MSDPKLKSITIYPIKSTSGVNLTQSKVEELGLAFDRRFVVTDIQGNCITARTHPRLCLVQASLNDNHIILNAPAMPTLSFSYDQLKDNYAQVQVWSDVIDGQVCPAEVNRWFSLYLKTPCQLLFFGDKSQRFVTNNDKSKRDTQVGFADGYPLLLISQASLNALNSRYTDEQSKISMSQFRPNLVVENCQAFAEDTWHFIRIGEVEFEVARSCTRCIFTTIDSNTAQMHQQQEPLTTLKQFRQVENGDILFGQNLIALNQGKIQAGDQIEVLSTKTPPIFIEQTKACINDVTPNNEIQSNDETSEPKITFTRFNKTITGNNHQTLLEQGEDADLLLPYSCRAGMCGRCKVKLVQGQVQQNCQDGLSEQDIEQGYILACSCVPVTDVTIDHPERKRRHIPND